jgi:ribosomal protein S18 acetylase RimI-like enzyme
MNLVIRPANESDREFILTTIVESEKSGGDVISYGGMFQMNEAEVRQLLSAMLDEDIPGQEVCFESFLIAEIDGERAAASASYVEGAVGMTAGIIKGNLLMHCVPRERLMASMDRMRLVASITHERTPGTLQIESGYTDPRFRGHHLFSRLLHAHIARRQAQGIPFSRVEMIMIDSNERAKALYVRIGFEVLTKKGTDNPEIFNLLPGNTKVQLAMKLPNTQNSNI